MISSAHDGFRFGTLIALTLLAFNKDLIVWSNLMTRSNNDRADRPYVHSTQSVPTLNHLMLH